MPQSQKRKRGGVFEGPAKVPRLGELPPAMAALATPLPVHQIKVIISEKNVAIQKATATYAPKVNKDGHYRLDVFCDGSLQLHQKTAGKSGRRYKFETGTARPGGYGVVSNITSHDTWGFAGKAFRVEEAYSITQCEKMGIAEARAMAAKKVENEASAKYDNVTVRVFADATNSLTDDIQKGVRGDWSGSVDRDSTRPIDLVIIGLSERLRARDCSVELHWVPRNDAPVHKMADVLLYKGHSLTYGGEPFQLAERSEETRALDAEVTKAIVWWYFKPRLMRRS